MQTTKYVEAYFNGGLSTKTRSLYQYDYGQVLTFPDLITPLSYQVQFCNSGDTQTIEAIGNADGVAIPDDVLRAGTYINVYVFLHDTETDGETRYSIIIPVNRRPEMSDIEPTPTEQREIDQLVSALNDGINRAETAAENAEASELAAHDSAEAAAQSEQTATEAANTAVQKASEAENSATASAQSATASAESAEASAQSASESATSADRAEQAATSAAASATAASGSASDSAASATAAEGFAGNASTAAGTASQAAQNASQSATAASDSATAAAGSATTAGNKASEAAQSATGAAASATAAGTAATNAQTAQTAAEAAQTAAETAQDAAEDAAESVEGKAAQIDQNTEDISLLKSHLEATQIVNEASGAIASFADGSDGVPLRDLISEIVPVQDLHGMPYPYPAGTTANLIPDGTDTANGYAKGYYLKADGSGATNSGYYISEYFPVTAGETYTWSANFVASIPSICFYDANKDYISGINANSELPITFTAPSGAVYARSTQGRLESERILQLETGSTATTPMRYSNICPISGRTEVNVYQRSVNLFDGELEYGNINDNTGNNSGTSTSYFRSKNYIPVPINSNIYLYSPHRSGNFHQFYYDKEKNYLGYTGKGWNRVYDLSTLNYHDKICYMRYRVSGNLVAEDAQTSFNYPSTETGYIPYNGQTIQIPLGQTIYGGSLDVVSGVLTVDHAAVNVGDLTWSATSTTGVFMATITDKAYFNDLVCSAFQTVSYALQASVMPNYSIKSHIHANEPGGATSYRKTIYIKDTDYSDADAFKTAMTEQTIVYELYQPLTVQLSAQQISTLLGMNNVWSDAGDVNVDYVADTKLYISQLTEPDADMIADANITSGKYFMVANNLFLATANIASGAAIVPGVNCTRTSLAAALNAINS